MDNLRVITVLGAFGGGVANGGGGGSNQPAPLVDMQTATHICNGKRYILRASDLSDAAYNMCMMPVCANAQAEIWLDNDDAAIEVSYPPAWLWSNDGRNYEQASANGVSAPQTQCGYRQVFTLRHDGCQVLANLAYQYPFGGVPVGTNPSGPPTEPPPSKG